MNDCHLDVSPVNNSESDLKNLFVTKILPPLPSFVSKAPFCDCESFLNAANVFNTLFKLPFSNSPIGGIKRLKAEVKLSKKN